MIYPNGHIDISQLLMMIESPEYAVYFESKERLEKYTNEINKLIEKEDK